MRIELNADFERIRDYVATRISTFNVSSPDIVEGGQFVGQIVMGFEAEQSGWFCLVFDSRDDALLDGEWTVAIDKIRLEMKHWADPLELDDDESFEIVMPDGEVISSDDFDGDSPLSEAVGQAARELFRDLIDTGQFSPLPLSQKCSFAIEDFNGNFGWTSDDIEDGDE